MLPSRITNQLLEMLTHTRFKITMILHINHPNEIGDDVVHALKNLHRTGIQLLNQSVLLKGINDDARILIRLSEELYSNHVLPYYLHLLDPVQGAAHFDVAEDSARSLINTVREQLPGYLVPRLVRETPNAPYKIPVD